MSIGAFSISLAVKDLAVSRAFYEKLGFAVRGGDAEQGWLILSSGSATVGLFQGMFEDNILTFNPGWSQSAEPLAEFEDVRTIQTRLKQQGVEFSAEADTASTGPAHFVTRDPDGNVVMFDQHVPKPG